MAKPKACGPPAAGKGGEELAPGGSRGQGRCLKDDYTQEWVVLFPKGKVVGAVTSEGELKEGQKLQMPLPRNTSYS